MTEVLLLLALRITTRTNDAAISTDGTVAAYTSGPSRRTRKRLRAARASAGFGVNVWFDWGAA